MPFSFRRGGSPKRLPWFALVPQNAPAPVLAAERHYLQFDGVGDYAVADAVFGGISGDYTIAIKVAGRNATGVVGRYFHAGKNGVDVRRDYCDQSTTTLIMAGYNEAGTLLYSRNSASTPADTSARVLAIKRVVAGSGAAKARSIQSSGVEWTSDDTIAAVTAPVWLGVGARFDTGPAIVANYGDVKFVALVLASAEVPDAELTAWLNADTAIGNITGIDHYWAASDIDGATIPARVGTVALALTGPTSSDLVAWAPA